MIALIARNVPWFVAVILLAIIGFPKAAAQLVLMLYPRGDERRRVIWADFCALPPFARYEWVLGAIKLGFTEGLSVRHSRSRERRTQRRNGHEPDRVEVQMGYFGLAIVAAFTASDALLPPQLSYLASLILAALMIVDLILLKVHRLNRRDAETSH